MGHGGHLGHENGDGAVSLDDLLFPGEGPQRREHGNGVQLDGKRDDLGVGVCVALDGAE